MQHTAYQFLPKSVKYCKSHDQKQLVFFYALQCIYPSDPDIR